MLSKRQRGAFLFLFCARRGRWQVATSSPAAVSIASHGVACKIPLPDAPHIRARRVGQSQSREGKRSGSVRKGRAC